MDATLPGSNDNLMDGLPVGKLADYLKRLWEVEKSRLLFYFLAGLLIFITNDFLRLTVGFNPTKVMLLLFFWLLAVIFFRLPGRLTILFGLAALMLIPFSYVYVPQRPSWIDSSALLSFWLLVLGTFQIGWEAGREGRTDVKPEDPIIP